MNEINQLKKLTESLDRIEEGTDPAVSEAADVLEDWSLDDAPQDLMDYFVELTQRFDSPFTNELKRYLPVASVDDPADLLETLIEITNEFGGNI